MFKQGRLAVLLCLAFLGGCALTPDSPEGKALHESLWRAQQERNAQVIATAPASGRLLVLAAGLSDETRAFPGDVRAMVQRLAATRADVLVWQLWNAPFGEETTAPFATRESLRRAIAEMRSMAKPGDRMLVMFATHGNRDQLANVVANHRYPAIRGAELQQLLAPLSEWDTGLVISACYSGSLIPALKHPRRWIMTAAAADRSSYGCQFHGKQTYFIRALLETWTGPEMGLVAWHAAAGQRIQAGEDAEKLNPSQPQLWIGAAVEPYRQTLSDFWRP